MDLRKLIALSNEHLGLELAVQTKKKDAVDAIAIAVSKLPDADFKKLPEELQTALAKELNMGEEEGGAEGGKKKGKKEKAPKAPKAPKEPKPKKEKKGKGWLRKQMIKLIHENPKDSDADIVNGLGDIAAGRKAVMAKRVARARKAYTLYTEIFTTLGLLK